MLEVGAVIGKNGRVLYWHLPAGRTAGSLPDSRFLWDFIWESRDRLLGFAHSHPGSGIPGPSHTDVTTFKAIEKALGCKLDWWITSRDSMVLCRRQDVTNSGSTYSVEPLLEGDEPGWVYKLREHSYVPERTSEMVPWGRPPGNRT